jgi:hypothetical protein
MLAAVTSFQYIDLELVRYPHEEKWQSSQSSFEHNLHNFSMTELPRCTLMSISLQTIFERLSDLARELLATCFIEDTLS